MTTSSTTPWTLLRSLGILLALGPIWGAIGTVIGMIHAFQGLAVAGSEASPDAMADSIRTAMYSTYAGALACPIGAFLIILSLRQLQKTEEESFPSTAPPPPPPPVPPS